jgi:hypothetical protein
MTPTLPTPFDQRSIFISILIHLLSEGKAGEAWETSNKAMVFRISRNTGEEKAFHYLVFKELNVSETDSVRHNYKMKCLGVG